MKNTCPFYIVFQVLNVHLTEICNIDSPDLLFLVFISFYISRQVYIYHFSQIFRTYSILSVKKILSQFFFFSRFIQPRRLPPTHPPLNDQNLLSVTKVFFQCSHNTVQLGWDNKNQQPKCCQEGARPHQKVKIPKIQR